MNFLTKGEDALRNEIYKWCRNLMKEGHRLEAIFLLLATWNFAYFRYQMIDFDLDTFKRTLASCDFDYFERKKFQSIDLEDEDTANKIKEIYLSLSEFKGLILGAASKQGFERV